VTTEPIVETYLQSGKLWYGIRKEELWFDGFQSTQKCLRPLGTSILDTFEIKWVRYPVFRLSSKEDAEQSLKDVNEQTLVDQIYENQKRTIAKHSRLSAKS
jgi:hypothetical protein